MFAIRTLTTAIFVLFAGGFILGSSGGNYMLYRVSYTSTGTEPDNDSNTASVSGDGSTVVFTSLAENIVPDDTNKTYDVFMNDLLAGDVIRISSPTGGGDNAVMSFDGRYIAFVSWATDLVPNDTNSNGDIFVYDRVTDHYERISVSSTGQQANSWSHRPSISADGRYVAFASLASNLVPNDYNNNMDIFVRDRLLNTTSLATVSMPGGYVWGQVDAGSISADGRFVVFSSYYAGLVPGDTNGCDDVFIRDMELGITKRVSVNSVGIQGNSYSVQPSISGDGRFVAFSSQASNFVTGDDSGYDVFVHDNDTGQTILVSKSSQGVKGNNFSDNPKISLDGRYVVFQSNATNLVPDDTNNYCGTNYLDNCRDVFLHDLLTGETRRVSVTSSGGDVNGGSGYPSISADGTVIVFESAGFNIVGTDENYHSDIYAYAWQPDMNLFLPYIER